MKILVAGDWHSDIHEKPLSDAFIKLGHEVRPFSWHERYDAKTDLQKWMARAESKFLIGPRIHQVNDDLFDEVKKFRPDILFAYRGTHILPDTLDKIHKESPSTYLIGYNNDNPFSEKGTQFGWRHFIASIPKYDLNLAYRHENMQDFAGAGAKRVELLRSWFIPERNRPVELSAADKQKYSCDVAFIGHFEADGREQYLAEIVNRKFDFRLFGPEWNRVIDEVPELKKFNPVSSPRAEEYNKAINGARVGLCFLSKLNHDTYTRRCFEIPATRRLLLSEFSEDLNSMFKEGVEADYFRSKDELIDKLDFYIKNPAIRERVAQAGYDKVFLAGHDVTSRAKQIINWYQEKW
ncbi:MAG: glycosyltransferase [Xanthomonadaceae bacterium]|nr:glycosyltransferase [Xanthomonadaceae bacterium]